LPATGGDVTDLWDAPAPISDMALGPDGKLYLGSSAGLFVHDPAVASPPTALLAETATTIEIAGDNIYYFQSGKLFRMPLAGGASELLTDNVQIPSGSDAESVLALGGGRIYLMTKTSSEGLHWLPLTGGEPLLLHEGKILIGV